MDKKIYTFMMKYNWKITLKKALWITGEVIVAGVIVYLADNNLWLGIVPIFEALRNWLKHKN
ncbi:unnamed protein product [marine sediment metagenome]|uniref:Uncharacterized protein n=1 Tax=marine sediment metagenome TaxID=412755 RepID=X1DXE1_9ZZZZ